MPAAGQALPCFVRIGPVHLRMPSIDRGVQSFIWSIVFFVYLYFGMVAIAIGKGTALIVSVAAAVAIFVFVRTRGSEDVDRSA